MKRLFKWNYKPTGNCPVQSEGWVLNKYFYFRPRNKFATIEFYNSKEDFDSDNWIDPIASIKLKETDTYKAGWLSKRLCTFLIFKGCLKFALK